MRNALAGAGRAALATKSITTLLLSACGGDSSTNTSASAAETVLSITSDGSLMLFNDGLGSENQPAGAPTGQSRTYSAVSAYTINAAAMTAENTWNFDYGQSIYSSVCSSAYEAASSQSLLVDYAVADIDTQARLVGLDPNHNVVFDFQYSTGVCTTSWNAVPIAFDNLQIQ